MVLFSTAIQRNSILSKSFPFLCPRLLVSVVQLILVKCVLFLVAVISLFLLFLWSLWVALSIYRCCLQCWQIIFHFFLSDKILLFHLSDVRPCASSLVFLLSATLVGVFFCRPEYLTKGIAQVFFSWMKLLPQGWVSSRSFVLLRYSFSIFSFIYTCLMVPATNVPKYLKFFFSQSIYIFNNLIVFFPSDIRLLSLLIYIAHFFYDKSHRFILTVYSYCF